MSLFRRRTGLLRLGQSPQRSLRPDSLVTLNLPPHRYPPLMRPCCFLLVVVFIIAACCHSISTAERAPQTKTQELTYNHDLTVAENVKLYLKDIKKAATEEERAFPGGTQLRGFFEKIGQGTNAKIAVDKVKQALHKDTRHASVSVAISLLKMLIVVGVISVASGYIVYRVTNS
ncbi:hypothetical protein PPTG_18644 [Phytophthora nicotianae INRA-310]|uniref:RxLR effector protein n=1 Tax=Phytophthora nicotianae (strain INRA-310) TaxID=761204 RepID=W2PFN6_PHYN3|nr:hypothetical protein PPTG_18644 [Phytophthora nicotianae INRA-310]ETM99837.1 hypothetical protein PPTG_18644 [Phytophthora nicotianae INRA-310]